MEVIKNRRNNIIPKGVKNILIQKSLFLFDVDATLTPARQVKFYIKNQPIKEEMKEYLKELSKKHTIGAVGGSDLCKIKEQLQDGKIIIIKLSIRNI